MHPPKPARPSVLIVDDQPDVRLAYRFLLETDEFRVFEAADAEEALKRLSENPVDLLLTDLYMPGSMDGVGLVEVVKKMPPPRPAVIAMSGSPHLAYRSSLQAARYVGADACVTKPIGRTELVTTIRRLVGGGPALRRYPH